MSADEFERIREMYAAGHRTHGDTSAALMTPKGRHDLRFRPVVEELRRNPSMSVLDYGCGLGHLLMELAPEFPDVRYTGVDITPSFIESCNRRLGNAGKFELVEPDGPIGGTYDIVVCSGVFNLKTSESPVESLAYVENRIAELLAVCREVFICDFLSPFVDFEQDGAQHIPIETVAGWLVKRSLRRFVVRHDLLPYEFTVVVRMDSTIKRPENIFVVDVR